MSWPTDRARSGSLPPSPSKRLLGTSVRTMRPRTMKLVSVDLGAQSGRVAVGSFDGRRLSVSEVHRFPNVPVSVHERLHWDPLRLYDGVLEGLRAASRQGGSFASVAVDGWGVDFALLDRAGRLLQNPVHYSRQAYRERVRGGPPARPAQGDISADGEPAAAHQYPLPALGHGGGQGAGAGRGREAPAPAPTSFITGSLVYPVAS